MAKSKRKLTTAEKRVRRERKKKFETILIHGKQKRILREPTIDEMAVDGMAVDEFISRNAEPIWLHQNGYGEDIQE